MSAGERVHRFNKPRIVRPTLYHTNMYNTYTTTVDLAKWFVSAHLIIIICLSFLQTETSGCCSQARVYDIFGRDLQDVSYLI